MNRISNSGPEAIAARLRRWGLLSVLFLTLLLLGPGCTKTTHKEDPILDAVRAQVKALNKRDAAGAIAMMHPDAPGLDKTRVTTEQVTANFDLIYMIENLTVESATEDEAKVKFTQVTQRVSGPDFKNNRVVGIHTLRKSGGAWKIYYTQVLKIDYLD